LVFSWFLPRTLRSYRYGIDGLRTLVAEVAKHCDPKSHDSENAHIAEDELLVAALTMIAKHAMRPKVKEMAETALSTQDYGFSRWCA
jgi:hypothetical protein